jgi:hypothetical protein
MPHKDLYTIIVQLKDEKYDPPQETTYLYHSIGEFLKAVHRGPEEYKVLKLGRNCGKPNNEILEEACQLN